MVPHPTSVSVTLDGTKAATALIPVTGGTLATTGADGSVFTLTIPEKALGGDEKVTMTPLSSMTGLPFSGGLVAGVQLEPEGLQLFRMATLTIKPGEDVPIAKQVAISYHGTGDNLHMQMLGDVYDAFVNTRTHAGVVEYQCPGWESVKAGACWAARHATERTGNSTFVVKMDYAGTGLFANKSYDLPCTEYGQDCGGGNERTLVSLRHAPAA